MSTLSHDAAYAMAGDVLEMFAEWLMDFEKRDAFVEAYTRFKGRLEKFEESLVRRQARMNPSRN